MIHLYIEIDIDDDNYLYHKLIDYSCMLRIGCKPIYANQCNMAKICLKVIKACCRRLMNLYHLKPLPV
jgi:hypothetical protein